MPVYKRVNKNFFKKWSSEMAYVLGFLVADGSMDVNKRGAHYISLQIGDRDILEKIKKTICSEHKISIRKPNRENHGNMFRIQIGSKEICNDLRKLGLKENKTYHLVLPDVPKKYFGHFVRGYFDGDGHVWSGLIHKNRAKQNLALHTVFTSCSKDFLLELRSKLSNFGLGEGNLCRFKNAFRLQFSIKDSIMLYKLMYDNITNELFLERKKKVFDSFLFKRLNMRL